MNTEMDYLVIGNVLFDKKVQPVFDRVDYAKDPYALD
jgi:hypothetical protein